MPKRLFSRLLPIEKTTSHVWVGPRSQKPESTHFYYKCFFIWGRCTTSTPLSHFVNYRIICIKLSSVDWTGCTQNTFYTSADFARWLLRKINIFGKYIKLFAFVFRVCYLWDLQWFACLFNSFWENFWNVVMRREIRDDLQTLRVE